MTTFYVTDCVDGDDDGSFERLFREQIAPLAFERRAKADGVRFGPMRFCYFPNAHGVTMIAAEADVVSG